MVDLNALVTATANIDAVLFPIRELSLRTGVNSVTLRAWERRYGLLKPVRTLKGHRLYSDNDVESVNSILGWINKGVAVSKVKDLLDQNAPYELVNTSNEWQIQQIALMEALEEFNEDKVDHLYQQISAQYPAGIYIRHWLVPVLKGIHKNMGRDSKNTAMYVFLCSLLIARISARVISQDKVNRNGTILLTSLNEEDAIWIWLQAAWCLDENFYVAILDNLPTLDFVPIFINNIKPDYYMGHFEKGLSTKKETVLKHLSNVSTPVVLSGASTWLELKNTADIPSNVQSFSDPFEAVLGLLIKLSLK